MAGPVVSEPKVPEPGRGAGWLPRPVWLLLGTMLFVVVGIGLRFGWPIYRQQAAIRAIEAVGGNFGRLQAGPDWLRDLVGAERMRPLESVVFVNLNRTQVKDAGLLHLTGLTNLDWLNLNGTQITDAGLVHLAKLTNLYRLEISGTQITDAGLVHLAGLTNLNELSLEGTEITDAGLVHLTGLTNLRKFWLLWTQVTDAGVDELKRAIPGLAVER